MNINTNGSYSIIVNNSTWLSSAETFIRANNFEYDNYVASLQLELTTADSGSDILGDWQSVKFDYGLFDDASIKMNCTIKTYNNLNLIRFTQVNISNTSKYLNFIFTFNFIAISIWN